MAHNVYLCSKCNLWFDTREALKAHVQSGHKRPIEEIKINPEILHESEIVPEVETVTTIITESVETEDVMSRDEMIEALKEGGVISDGRSVSKKSDSEITEMYAVLKVSETIEN